MTCYLSASLEGEAQVLVSTNGRSVAPKFPHRLIITLPALAFCTHVFVAADARWHSVGDTLCNLHVVGSDPPTARLDRREDRRKAVALLKSS